MIQIYHNPRCRKSREALQLLESQNLLHNVILYLEIPPSKSDLAIIIKKLNIKPMQLVRTQEAIWKSEYKGKTLSDNDMIIAMTKHPKLIERPIVINGDKAVIGRPTENILTLL